MCLCVNVSKWVTKEVLKIEIVREGAYLFMLYFFLSLSKVYRTHWARQQYLVYDKRDIQTCCWSLSVTHSDHLHTWVNFYVQTSTKETLLRLGRNKSIQHFVSGLRINQHVSISLVNHVSCRRVKLNYCLTLNVFWNITKE